MTRSERQSIWRELREIYDVMDAAVWLEAPHPQLEERKPRDCTFDEVMAVIDRLKSGAFL